MREVDSLLAVGRGVVLLLHGCGVDEAKRSHAAVGILGNVGVTTVGFEPTPLRTGAKASTLDHSAKSVFVHAKLANLETPATCGRFNALEKRLTCITKTLS